MEICQSYLAADVIVVQIDLQSGQGNALNPRLCVQLVRGRTAGRRAQAGQVAGFRFAEVGGKPVRAVVRRNASVPNNRCIGQRNAVSVKRRQSFRYRVPARKASA